jgi:peptidoglycan/xylan/chitin deacetylase (PgdA/CDA1 family)
VEERPRRRLQTRLRETCRARNRSNGPLAPAARTRQWPIITTTQRSLAVLGRRAVKLSAAGADLVRGPVRGIPILLYHRIGGRTASEVDLPSSLFDEQLATIESNGTPVTLDGAVEALSRATPVDGAVAITFDDGTADFADAALPLLVAHAIPATLYVATDFIENQIPFPGDATPLSWAAIRDCISTGLVTVGSHTHTHALLDRVDGSAAAAELDRSIGLIEERLGVHPAHFAYPKAVLGSSAAEAEVRRRFRSAAIAGTRSNPFGASDSYRLRRSPIQVADGMWFFRRKLAGGLGFEDSLRRMVNRRRYAGLTT